MGRPKLQEEKNLRHVVKARINTAHYQRLRALLAQSKHRTMSELVRVIICERPVTIYTVDGSLDTVMEELVRIRQELQAIGQNINQTTRFFHNTASQLGRLTRLEEVAVAYREVGSKTDALLSLITQLSQKWLEE